MAQFKCKACGSTLTIDGQEGVTSCKSCGLEQTLPTTSDATRLEQYSYAYTTLQNKEYDKAILLFKKLKELDADGAEAYWGAALCRYGATYGKNGIAELNRVQEAPFVEQADYKMAIEKANPQQKQAYEATAAQIDQLRNKILGLAKQQAPVNVLLLCKATDNNGNRTPDAAMADTLYDALVKSGLRVFYAAKDLKDKPSVTHEAYAYAALTSMQVTLVVGTKPEYFNAPEIRGIWLRALSAAVGQTPTCSLVPVYRSMAADQLPKEFAGLRTLEASKPEMVQVIVRGVQKLVEMHLAKKQSGAPAAAPTAASAEPAAPAAAPEAVAATAAPAVSLAAASQIKALLDRAYQMMKEGKWQNASEMATKVRRIDPKCYEAYIVLLLCSLKLKSAEELPKATVRLEGNQFYTKALEYATIEQKVQLEGYAKAVAENLKNAELERKYAAATSLIQSKKFDQAITALSEISDYKDSAALIERCKEAVVNAPKEELYRKTLITAASKDANPAVWKKCIAALTTISGFKDADEQIKTLQARIEKFEKDKKEAEDRAKAKAEKEKQEQILKAENLYAKRKKRKKGFGIASLILTLLLIVYIGAASLSVFVVVPGVRYNNANDAFLSNDYNTAESIYADLNSHKNSDKHIAAIQAIRLVEQCKQPGKTQANAEEFAKAIRTLLAAGVPVDLSYQTEGGSLEQREYLSSGTTTPIFAPLAEQTNAFSYTTAEQFSGIITPGRDGYTFDDWTLVTFSYDVTQEEPVFAMEIKANWVSPPNQYEIKLEQGDLGNGAAPDEWTGSVTYNIESPSFDLPVPQREGYTFVGWTLSAQETPAVNVTVATGSFGDKVYTAHWKANEYSINLDLAGGEFSESKVSVTFDEKYQLPDKQPTRKGYDFVGWYIVVDGEEKLYVVEDKWTTNGDITLVAKWDVISYNVTYLMQGGTNSSANPALYTVEDTVSLKAPTRKGYTFTGWTWEGQSKPQLSVTISKGTIGNLSYTANWKAKTYTITFNANGGTYADANKTVTFDARYSLGTPTRKGYDFDGWYRDNQEFTQSGTWTWDTNVTLTARWTPIQYSIQYDLAGGSVNPANPETYTVEDSFILTKPTRVGYTFLGWTYVDQTTPVETVTIPKGSVDDRYYTANWKANEYTAKFDANGGDVDVPSLEIVYGEAYTLPTPTRKGYNFNGWYRGNTRFENGTWKLTENITLTAHWTPIQYSIKYVLNGGTNAYANPGTYNIENEITLAAPSRKGYTFEGWTYEGQTTPKKDVVIAKGTIDALTFTANWKANDYTITFNTDGGELTNKTMTVTYDKQYTLPTPTKTGYEFVGWYDGSTQVKDGTWTYAGNKTLTAKWEAKSYTITLEDIAKNPDWETKVTFVYNDNVTSDAVVSLKPGEILKYPAIPSREGYVFAGWYTDEELTDYYEFNELLDDMTLYAKWEIAFQSADVLGTILEGETKSFYTSGSTKHYYTFVPQTSGSLTFTFASENGKNVCGYLYSWNGTSLSSVKSATGSGYSHRDFSYSVNAGQVYYLAIYHYSSSSSGNLNVSVSGTPLTSTAVAPGKGPQYLYSEGDSIEMTVTYDQAYTLLTMSRTGYTFGGWNYGEDLVTSDTWKIASDAKLTPDWIPSTHVITLDPNGGTVDNTTVNVTFDKAFTLPTPTKTGYEFVGWFNGETKVEDGTWTGLTDLTLTAKWKAKTYNITFTDVNKGPNVTFVYNDDVTEDKTVALETGKIFAYPEIPTRDGYVFAGWYTDSEYTEMYTFTGDITEDMTLYAKWVPAKYTISGYIGTGETKTVTSNGTTVYYYAFVPMTSGNVTFSYSSGNYMCAYLYRYDEVNDTLVTMYSNTSGYYNRSTTQSVVAGQVYYVAIRSYYDNSYELSVKLSGEVFASTAKAPMAYQAGSNATQQVTYDQSFTLPTPVRPGYTFKGWYNGETQVTDGTWTTASDLTLTAKWEANQYQVTLNVNGGEMTESTNMTVTYDQAFKLPEPTRTGYTFLGWYAGETKYESGTWTGTANVSLTAKWTKEGYKITYDLAGGTNHESNPDLYTVDDTVVLKAPTRDGYTFLGWTYEGQSEPTLSVTIAKGTTGNLAYTANWKVNAYNITFDANGGQVDTTSAKYTYDQTYTLPVPTRVGYTFAGWFNNDVEYKSGAWKGAADMTLVAKWTANTYDVTFKDVTDTSIKVTLDYNDQVTEDKVVTLKASETLAYPEIPTRDGYVFAGWYTDSEYTEMYTFKGEITKDMTLYAKWVPAKYTISGYIGTGETKSFASNGTTVYYYAFVPMTSGSVTFSYSSGNYMNAYLYRYDEASDSLATLYNPSYSYSRSTTQSVVAGQVYYVAIRSYYNSNYTLTIKLNGSKFASTASVPMTYAADKSTVIKATYGQTFTLPTPVRPGYTFLGWYNGEEKVTSGTWETTSAMTLIAKWEVNSYTVQLNVNGGVGVIENKLDVTYDEAFTLPTPSRKGYTFLGWYDGDTKYESGTWKHEGNVSLTAKWSANTDIKYVVNHYQENLNDDEYTLFLEENLTGEADTIVTPAVKNYAGFIAPTAQTVTILPDGSQVVNYYYTRVRITATLITNNGENAQEIELKYTADLKIEDPVREGYTFGGWYTDYELTKKMELTKVPAEDMTLYAYWVGDSKPGDFIFSGTDTLTVVEYIGKGAVVAIPESVSGKPVVAISADAFKGKTHVTSLKIPESITSIPTGLLKDCTALTELSVSLSGKLGALFGTTEGTGLTAVLQGSTTYYIPTSLIKVTTIGKTVASGAFENCVMIKEIHTPYATTINSNAFKGCSALEKFNSDKTGTFIVPDTVTTIGKGAFNGCTSITDITLPFVGNANSYNSGNDTYVFGYIFGTDVVDGVKAVQQYSSSYYIPASIRKVTITTQTSISGYAFAKCDFIESITLNENTTTIGQYAFWKCSKLSSLNSDKAGTFVIPETVTSIGSGAFGGCTSIVDITLPFVGNKNNTSSSSNGNYVFGYIFGTSEVEGATATKQYNSTYYIPDSIRNVTVTVQTTVPAYAFYGCKYIESVTIPEETTAINSYAFRGCTALKRLNSSVDGTFVIPENVTVISSYAFYQCEAIDTLVLSKNVAQINNYAFYQATKLKTITLPQTHALTTIGDYAFCGCTALIGFKLIPDAPVVQPAAQATGVVFELPEGLKTIGANAFRGVSEMTTLIVPKTVTAIGAGAFGGCNKLTDITLPFIGMGNYNVSASTGGNSSYVFGYIFGTAQTEGATQVQQSNTTYYIPTKIRNVTITVQTTLPAYAFYDCSFIDSVTLPEETTVIGQYAFSGCDGLNTLNSSVKGTFNLPASLKTVSTRAFFGCESLVTLVLDEQLTAINNYAFSGAIALETVVVPETSSLLTIGDSAFADCSKLTRFDVAEKEEITEEETTEEETTKEETTSKEEATTEGTTTEEATTEEVTTEGATTEEATTEEATTEEATTKEEATTEEATTEEVTTAAPEEIPEEDPVYVINLPAGLTSIGANAFKGAKLITTVIVPDSVTSIGSGAFGGCTSITDITLPFVGSANSSSSGSNSYVFGYIFGTSSVEGTTGVAQYNTTYFIPNSIRNVTITVQTTIPAYAFRGCEHIETITIPEATTSIGAYAFSGCGELYSLNSDVKGVFNIPEGVATISSYVFSGCTAMTEVQFGEIKTIESYAFNGCEELIKINSDTANTAIIPATVTSIGSSAFKNCNAIYDWTLPFVGQSINATGTSGVFGYIFGTTNSSTLGAVVQNGNYYLIPGEIIRVTITDQTAIPEYAFQNCKYIEEIYLPDDTKSIGNYAFQNCTALKQLNSETAGEFIVPTQVTTLNNYVFAGCTELTKVSWSSLMTTIGTNAFDGCTKLASINGGTDGILKLPYGLTSIGQYAFRDNKAFTKLDVPVTVTSIGRGAFQGCDALTEVTVPFVGNQETSGTYYAPFGYIFGYTTTNTSGTTHQYGTSTRYYYYIPTGIATVNVTNQTALPANAFRNCTFITTINLLKDASGHGTDAFTGCESAVKNTLDPVIAPAWNGTDVATEFNSGTGTKEDPYVIFTGAQLAYLAQQVNSGTNYAGVYFVLGGDIRLGGNAITVIGASADKPFKGILDGKGFVISNFTVNSTGTAAGLFGYMQGEISNLGVENATVSLNATSKVTSYAGAFVAYNEGTITNCYVKGVTVTTSCEYEVFAGGFVGHNGGKIADSYANVTVNAQSSNKTHAGGFVGENTKTATITGCAAFGNVTAIGRTEYNSTAGGFVGGREEDGEDFVIGTIENCYRVDTQTLVRYNTNGGPSNLIGTQATLDEIHAYMSSSWNSSVWDLVPNYPVLVKNF